jgi:hypothetical protein
MDNPDIISEEKEKAILVSLGQTGHETSEADDKNVIARTQPSSSAREKWRSLPP